jgi:hypothetical protein
MSSQVSRRKAENKECTTYVGQVNDRGTTGTKENIEECNGDDVNGIILHIMKSKSGVARGQPTAQ